MAGTLARRPRHSILTLLTCVTIGAAAMPVAAVGPASGGAVAAGRQAVSVTGTVRDETGGVLPGVTVHLLEPTRVEPIGSTVTDVSGTFAVDVPAGEYRLQVSLPSFNPVDRTIRASADLAPVEITLPLAAVEEQVDVDLDPVNRLRLDPLASLTAQTLSAEELQALPTDEADLVAYLLLLAGADSSGDVEADAAGFIIDGFDQGRLPDPDEIAQIIVDPTPLRADGRGDGPRIEIITRPGTGRWRRSVDFDFADESLDATTPGERTKPARQTRDFDVDLSGPVVADVLDIDVEATTRSRENAGDSLRAVTPARDIFEAVVQPETAHELQVETDIAVSPSRSLGVDLAYETRRSQNGGVGGFTLPDRGIDRHDREWSLQVSERRLGDDLANDLRIRVQRDASMAAPLSAGVAIDVADAFSRGGGTERSLDETTRIQAEDRLRWARGDWSFQAGVEGSYEKQHTVDEDNFNGTFDFASLPDYCRATGFAGVNCQPTQQLVEAALAQGVTPTSVDARGDLVEITGVPTTFRVTTGNPVLDISEVGVESFVQADRAFGERASLRLGLRYEATSHSIDYLRLDPTVNLQVRPFEGTILSAGARFRFQDFGDYERLIRNDGSAHTSELSISAPSYPDPFLGGTVRADEDRTSLVLLDPAYRSPTASIRKSASPSSCLDRCG